MRTIVIAMYLLWSGFTVLAQELDQGCWVGKMAWRDDYVSTDIATLRALAEQGNPFAQNNLGVCYANGQGVEQSWEEAVKWYRKSAEQGDETAQTNLGRRYANGQGVEQSWEEAAKWFRKAADQGDVYAQFLLGNCYADGKGVSQSAQEAVKWIAKAADQGYLLAQNDLIRRYAEGDGVERSLQVAIELQRKINRQESMDKNGKFGVGLIVLGALLENQRYPTQIEQKYFSDEEKARFLKTALTFYPEDLFRANHYWWRFSSNETWFCSDGFRAEAFQIAGENPVLMNILIGGFSQAVRKYNRPAVAFWGPETIGWRRGEPLFSWAVWSLRDAENADNAPLSKQALLNLLESLNKTDPALGQSLLNQADASGTLPLYLAIQWHENDVAKAMIRLYDTSSLQALRGRDPTGKIVPSGENNNPADFAVSVMDCAVLADNADVVRLLVTNFSWPLDKKELWSGNAKDSPLSKAEYYHCERAKRALQELSTNQGEH